MEEVKKPCIVTFFMNNVHMKTVQLQRDVVEKFNKSNVPFYSIKTDMSHGASIDYFWSMNGAKVDTFVELIETKVDHDVVLVLDIDAIPLNEDSIDYLIEQAYNGKIVGNAQRSNHIDNGQHMFVAPSVVALSRETFIKIGSPSSLETSRSDVLEEYTWKAEENGVEVELLMPTRFDAPPIRMAWEKETDPYWKLADGYPNYGIGTTFGKDGKEMFWHNFQIFRPGQQERFWNKCEEILNG